MTPSISKLSVRGNAIDAPRRLLVEFRVGYDGEQWAIRSLTYVSDNRFIAIDLDPTSETAKVESGRQQIWAFWQRWQ